MTITSVETMVKRSVALTLVVLNGTGLGTIRQMQHAPDDIAGIELYDTSFARVAEAFGVTGIYVETSGELDDALTNAEMHGLPAVTNARTDRSQDMVATL